MRCNPLRWLWGLLPIAILGFAVVLGEQERIEADLRARVEAALTAVGISWVSTSFKGRDGELTGKSPEEVQLRKAADIARGVWGVRVIEDKTALLEEEKNYVWTAALRENRLKLAGFVPNDDARRAIVGSAKATFPGREIDDRMQAARGVPNQDVWLGGVSFALKQLARLKGGGRVDLEGTRLLLEGEAEDAAAFRNVRADLSGALPRGIVVKHNKVIPPTAKPYTWTANLAGNRLMFSGYVPNERSYDELLAAANRALPRVTVVDRMEMASGEPKGWLAAATLALQSLARLEGGAVELRDSQVTLSGEVEDGNVAEDVRKTLRSGLQAPFKASDQITVKPPVIKPVSPFTTGIVADRTSVTLTGFAPSDAGRKTLLEAVKARLPEARLDDQLQIAAGAPDGWAQCLKAGVQGLGRTGAGRLQVSDQTMELTAATDDEELAEALPGEVRAAANRACQAHVKITLDVPPEPNLQWRAVHGPGELLLEGEVPDAMTRTALVSAAGKLFVNARVIDRMRVSAARSVKWPKVADAGLKMLAKLRKGEIRLGGQELLVTGEAPDAASASAIRTELGRDLMRGYSGRDTVEVLSDAMIWAEQEAKRKTEVDAKREAEAEAKRKADAEAEAKRKAEAEAEAKRKAEAEAEARRKADAEAEAKRKAEAESKPQQTAELARKQPIETSRCETLLASIGTRGIVNFRPASAVVETANLPVLDRLAEMAKACPAAHIEISGHTDDGGSSTHNQGLSERRARFAANYLVRKGVAAARLSTAALGQTKPVAQNDSAANRAKNRRIEYTIRMN